MEYWLILALPNQTLNQAYRWNKGQLMDEYLLNNNEVLKKCGVISSSKSLSKPQETGKFDCWLCIQEYQDCKQDTFYPSQCGHQLSIYINNHT